MSSPVFPKTQSVTCLPLIREGSFQTLPDLGPLWSRWSAQGEAVWLDSGGSPSETSRWSVLAGKPTAWAQGREGDQSFRDASGTREKPWKDFLSGFDQGEVPALRFPKVFSAAWFGVMAYEFGAQRMGLDSKKPFPFDYVFFRPGAVVVLNHCDRRWWAYGSSEDFVIPDDSSGRDLGDFHAGPLRMVGSRGIYESRSRKILNYIAAGDIYQANLVQSFTAPWNGSPAALYGVLRRLNPGPYMGLFRGPGFTVASSSPERLVSLREGLFDIRPIAGTRPRGKTSEEDRLLRRQLRESPKERAEHVMLVDLARNDLGRVASYGSVQVEDLARVEPYAKVQHLVSTVVGRLRPGATLLETLDAFFPGGTITGCPKRRCMEILSDLETTPRGFYTGSLGYLAPGPQMDLNILIRTFTLWDNGPLEFHAGAGIVADSNPEREYMETLYKVEALAAALGTTLVDAS